MNNREIFKSDSEVIVAIDECYNDNWGSYDVIYIYDKFSNKLRSEVVNGMNPLNKYSFEVDGTDEDIQKAGEIYAIEKWDLSRQSSYNGNENTYIGCEVILSRSRKAPNKVPLKVTNYYPSYYDNKFNNRVPSAIMVVDKDGNEYVTSTSCIKEVIKGAYPFWYNPESV